jgi:outer membrane protein
MNTTPLKRLALVAMLAAGLAPALPAQAQATPWLMRLRAVELRSANDGSTTPDLGLSINNKVIPEFDISYFFTPQIAAELVLTYPQKQKIRSNGTEIGSLKHLPPTLTVQYHYTGLGDFVPYAGAGVNYTRFSNVEFTPAVTATLQPTLKKNSFGLAAQVGADYTVAPNVVLNLDIKKVQIRTDVSSFGTKIGDLKVDPWLIGFGVGYKF